MKHLSQLPPVKQHPSGAEHPAVKATADDGVLSLVSGSAPYLSYYLYVPRTGKELGTVLVAVHGVSRNAREQIDAFREMADEKGVTLVAPVFSREVFTDYQRLGRRGRGPRADLALIRVLNDVGSRLGCDTSKVDIFGFSGGAQFAHRFAFAHPQRVRQLVLGAAGWYTMPDRSVSYPYGIGDSRGLDAVSFRASYIARTQVLVVVGQEDNEAHDDELNRSRMVTKGQGENRVQRAFAWTDAMNRLAHRCGECNSAEMMLLPGVGHSFSQAVSEGNLVQHLSRFLYSNPGGVPASSTRSFDPDFGGRECVLDRIRRQP